MLFDKVYSHSIARPSRNNNICIFLGGKAELLEGRLDQRSVLVEHVDKISPSLFYISQHSPDNMVHVWVCFNE